MSRRPLGPLHDPETLQSFLGRHGLGAVKGLGQHFLISSEVVTAIVEAASGCPGILEIGPGPGVLTRPLSERAERLIALELDRRMGLLLAESAPRSEIRHEDALAVDLGKILDELPRPRALVSNMPYYITGPLLQRVADVRGHLDRAVLMMQREVANRVTAPAGSGDRGSLSVFLQAHFDIYRLIQVPASAFLPPPKVDSTVLVLTPRADLPSSEFFRLVRMGFVQPRKTLANNLAGGLSIPRSEVLDRLEAVGLTEKARAQELTEAQWQALAQLGPRDALHRLR